MVKRLFWMETGKKQPVVHCSGCPGAWSRLGPCGRVSWRNSTLLPFYEPRTQHCCSGHSLPGAPKLTLKGAFVWFTCKVNFIALAFIFLAYEKSLRIKSLFPSRT